MTANQVDHATSEASHPDLSAVEGDWVSVTGLPYGVSRVHTRRTDDTLLVRAYGAGGPRPGDWGEVRANGVFVMRTGKDFVYTAEFADETMTTLLQSYRSLGVLAVHVFHRFTDGSGRRDFFTRELYMSESGRSSPRRPSTTADGFPPALLSGDHDLSDLLGTWNILEPPATNISTLSCLRKDDGVVTVHAQGTDEDWGEAVAHVYTDGAYLEGPPAILATFDRGERLVHLEIRNFMGILVVGEYIEFTDGSGQVDCFVRECYGPG